jgi:hypothetical protein
MIDDGPQRQEFELRSEHLFNNGRSHRIQLDLDHDRLILDDVHNETLTRMKQRFLPNHMKFFTDRLLQGWIQDVRINEQLIDFDQNNQSSREFHVHTSNMNTTTNSPCYPSNPCLNLGICFLTSSLDYV